MDKVFSTRFLDVSRDVAKLALPALGTLLVVPLLTFTDSALAGFLGTDELAALTLGTTFITFVVGILIFFTFSTTTLVGKLVGENNPKLAIHRGSQYLWLGLAIGFALTVAMWFASPLAMRLFTDDETLIAITLKFTHIAVLLFPANLAFQATNGILRGLGDTKTQFYVSLFGVAVNVPISVTLVLTTNLGVAGLAIGTTTAQWLTFLAAAYFLRRLAWRYETTIAFDFAQFKQLGLGGLALFIRSAFLWATSLLTVKAAALCGTQAVAGHQIVMVLWNVSAFTLDSIAIAAQILFSQAAGRIGSEVEVTSDVRSAVTGTDGGGANRGNTNVSDGNARASDGNASAGNTNARAELRQLTIDLSVITLISGTVWLIIFLVAPLFWPALFSATPEVWGLTTWPFIIAGLMQPIVALVYSFDGILMGADKFWQLARMYGVLFACHAPMAVVPYLIWGPGVGGLTYVWLIYAAWLQGIRFIILATGIRRLISVS